MVGEVLCVFVSDFTKGGDLRGVDYSGHLVACAHLVGSSELVGALQRAARLAHKQP